MAWRARATVEEISDALRCAFGEYAAVADVVSNIDGRAYEDEPEYLTLVDWLAAAARALGRKPKVLVAKLGQDGHDRGAKVIASAFGDIGFEVTAGPLFQTPDEAAEVATVSRVDIVGISSLAAAHKTLAPQLIEALKARGAQNIIVVVGGVVPRQNYQFLLDCGVSAVFGPGTNVLDAAHAMLDLVELRRRNS